MATLVLVHPAWFGGWSWRKTVPLLRARGHEVYAPTLTGLGERAHLARPEVGLDTHVEDVVNAIEYEDLHDVVLVGNSSGGAVITGVADRVPSCIGHVVYLDAFVPEDGQSVLGLLAPERRQIVEKLIQDEGDGWLWPRFSPAPWEEIATTNFGVTDEADLRWMLSRLRPTPLGHFSHPVRRRDPAAERLPRTYVRCRQFPQPAFDRWADRARQADGWRFVEMDGPHLPYITHPQELVAVLDAIAR